MDSHKTNATTLLNISIGAVNIVDNYKPLSTEGKYEALLLNALLATIELQEKYGDSTNYLKTEEEFMGLIAKLAIKVEIIDKVGDIASFINNRMAFYHEELSNIYNGNYIPGKIYDAFYLNPLSDNPQAHNDLAIILVFQKLLLKMISETKEKTNSSIFSL